MKIQTLVAILGSLALQLAATPAQAGFVPDTFLKVCRTPNDFCHGLLLGWLEPTRYPERKMIERAEAFGVLKGRPLLLELPVNWCLPAKTNGVYGKELLELVRRDLYPVVEKACQQRAGGYGECLMRPGIDRLQLTQST
jgi:hypothetical protein